MEMINIIGWEFGMDTAGLLLLLVGAIVIGVVAQIVGETRTGWEGVVAAVGAGIGGWLGSESLGTLSTWGPQVGDLYVLPALIGAVVLGFVFDAVVRTMTHGSYTHHPRPI
jgi:uncharacterized membrane protein YeaQ/YmgE (transglycosylase-associated protein family)